MTLHRNATDAKDCPICGGKPVYETQPGDYGYTNNRARIVCVNSLEPYDHTSVRTRATCWVKMPFRETEEWHSFNGTFNIEPQVKAELITDWNKRP